MGLTQSPCPCHIYMKRVNVHLCLTYCLSPVRLHDSEACALEDEQTPKVALSIWSPKLSLQQSFSLVMTCKHLHCGHASYAERSASLSNQHFCQGKHSTMSWPHLTRSLNVQNPVISGRRDCSLSLRLLPDTQRRGRKVSQ